MTRCYSCAKKSEKKEILRYSKITILTLDLTGAFHAGNESDWGNGMTIKLWMNVDDSPIPYV